MKNIVIIGASGHGSVVLDCIEKEGLFKVIGYIDSYKKKGKKHNGLDILGSEYEIPYLIEKHNVYGGIIAIGNNWIRQELVAKIAKLAPNFQYITVVHPSATIGKGAHIGRGSVIMPGVIVNCNSWVGDFCIINTNASLGHDSRMNNFSSLAPRVCTGGNFVLGKFSAICLGANIIENITVGEQTVIGAGSLVVTDIQPYVVAYGVPVKVIRQRSAGEPYLTGDKKSYLAKVVNDK
ncbi:acetyltransferase [Arenibacter sp. GZD96]|uniref:acetyltransferase n=1 Tax=Aurantibrevibacter litoralis TaxID=3106030 RepID=UPI002AFE3036|nr:acetyltransferase [Arenibacter sp. GZD-96]MEA1785804.1 acetyltransferase [Arenibacter sp. GZD-96]